MSQLPPCSRGGHGAGGFGGGLVACLALHGAHMSGLRVGKGGQRRDALGIGVEQLGFAAVPHVEHLAIRQTADQTGMDEARIFHPRHMARLGEHAVEIPDGFLCFGEMLGQETATVLFREKAVEPPEHLFLGADIQDVDHQQIARLGPFDADRAGEVMNLLEFHVAHVRGVIVVLDLTTCPVIGLDLEIIAGFDPDIYRNVRMPAVMDVFIGVRIFRQID